MDTNPRRDAVTLHCSSCGAPFPAAATVCLHCNAAITLEERNLDCLCDVCGARMSSSARFCMRCGKPAALQPVAPLPTLAPCPRCKGRLRERALAGGSALAKVVECGNCGGLWLAPAALDALCANAESMQGATAELLGRPLPPMAIDGSKITYLSCPTCRDMMVRRNFGGTSGVIVDVCKNHGVWLDHAELEKVLAFVRAGGLVRAREREVKRLESEAKEARDRRSIGSGMSHADWSAPSPLVPEYGLGDLFGDLLGLFGGRRFGR